MATFTLNLYITGLAMLVPDKRTDSMYVILPAAHEHAHGLGGHGQMEEHLARLSFLAALDASIPSHDTPTIEHFEADNKDHVELTIDGTYQEITSSLTANKASMLLPNDVFVKITDWSPVVPRRLLDQGEADPRVNVLFRLNSGRIAETYVPDWVWWEFKEDLGQYRQMTNAIQWQIEGVSAPLMVTDSAGTEFNLVPQGGDMTLVLSHSINTERPSKWKKIPTPKPGDYEDGYAPPHFAAFRQIVGSRRPNPRLRSRLANAVHARAVTVPFDVFGTAVGIHPVTCIITGGDPEGP
jgi:hypothetical protein